MQNLIKRILFAAIVLVPLAVGTASAQYRSYGGNGGGSSYSGGGHYQAGRSAYGGSGYHYGASGAGHNGMYASHSYAGAGSHPSSGSGRSYGSGASHSSYSPSRSYSTGVHGGSGRTGGAASYGGGVQTHLTRKPEIEPHIGGEMNRVGGFSAFSSQKEPEIQHPTRVRRSRYGATPKKSANRIQGVKVPPSPNATKTYDKPINMAGKGVSHVPGTGSGNPKDY